MKYKWERFEKMERSTLLTLLFCLLLEVVFAETTPLNRFIGHYEPVEYDHRGLMWHHHRVRRSLIGERKLNLKFHALGRHFDLDLAPDKHLFHPQFTVQDSGKPVKKGDALSYLYTGTDKNDPTSRVHGNVVHGVFEGSIFTEEETYRVEPASRYFDDADAPPSFHSVIYRLSDLDTSALAGSHCGATQEFLEKHQKTQNSVPRTEARSKLLRRQAGRNSTKVRCWLNVIGDYDFFMAVTTPTLSTLDRRAQAIALLSSFIRDASTIYQTTDFTGDGNNDLIEFGIQNIDINTMPPTDFTSEEFLGVEAYLTGHSAFDWSQYCLSYRFTYRDFDGGVLGLAYVAQPGSRNAGGICPTVRDPPREDVSTLNTGIVTLLNYGQRVPSAVTTLTFAHEAGHNFGSVHDPETEMCAPSSSNGGNYIMYAFASSGNNDNNDEFSPCSRDQMDAIIADRGQSEDGCFVTENDRCGNGIVDEGETCDCGSNCDADPCCNGEDCTLASGGSIVCSPDEGPCCSESCNYLSNNITCAMASDCALAQVCNGSSAVCPDLVPRDEVLNLNLTCSDGTGLCAADGTCTATVCDALGIESCECTEPELSCDICCQVSNETCVSTIVIAEENTNGLADMLPGGMGRVQVVGFPCSNFTGYCDFFNNCMPVDSEGALDRLASLFTSESVSSAIDWLERMWWVVVIGVIAIIVALFIIVLIVHVALPRPKHIQHRAERRKTIRRSRRQNRPGAMVTTGVELRNPQFVG